MEHISSSPFVIQNYINDSFLPGTVVSSAITFITNLPSQFNHSILQIYNLLTNTNLFYHSLFHTATSTSLTLHTMFSKSALILGLAASTFAAPQPQQDFNIIDAAKSLVSEYSTARPTGTDAAKISSHLSDARIIVSKFSGLPSLPTSVASVLDKVASKVPESNSKSFQKEVFCSPTAASWYSSLDKSAQVALTSYVAALQTWVAGQSKQVDDSEDFGLFPDVPVCDAMATRSVGGATTRAPSSSATGSATAKVTALSTSSLPAAATTNGAVMGSIVGVVGIIGVIAAL